MGHDGRAIDAGRLVRAARAAAGLSQAELARTVGTTQSVISRWERGHDEPRLSTLERVARACGLRLVLHLEPEESDGVDRAQILQQLALTPEERLESVINVGRVLADLRPVP